MTRARELASGLALAAVSLALLALGLEALLRVLGLPAQRYSAHRELIAHGREVRLDCYPANPTGGLDLDLRDPEVRQRYQPLDPERYDRLAREAPYAVEVRYNSLGFRDAEPGPKIPGVLRVVVLGDSFTEGQGVRVVDAYPAVLGRLLDAAEPGRWETRNCGRRGADLPGLFERFEAALALEPDMVVYGFVLNDPVRSPEFQARQTYVNDWILQRARPGLPRDDAGPWGGLHLSAFLRDRLETWRVSHETTRWYLEMYGEPNAQGWRRTQVLIRRMHRRMQERGGRFLLAVWPLLVGLDGDPPLAGIHATMRAFCADAGIPHHDLLDALRGQGTESLWVHPGDMHPNAKAHRLVAESLAPVVRGLAREQVTGAALAPRPRPAERP